MTAAAGPLLTIVADDYGYAESYSCGILAAVCAGAVDGVSVMAMRAGRADELTRLARERGVELGLHLEPADAVSAAAQLRAFRAVLGRDPAYLDGHHHCHAQEPTASEAQALAISLGAPVRAVDDAHRARLRGAGIGTADVLVGRLSEAEPVIPPLIESWLERGAAPEPARLVEWMVHPGHPDPDAGSAYDEGRGEDLAALERLGNRAAWARKGVRRVSPVYALNIA